MPRIFTYSGLATKVKGMESHLLTQKDYEEMSSLKTVSDVISYLKKIPSYARLLSKIDDTSLHRMDLEKLIKASIMNDFLKLYGFANPNQKKYLDVLFKRFEVDLIKQRLTSVLQNRAPSDRLPNNLKQQLHSKIDFTNLYQCVSFEQFLHELKGTSYYDLLETLSHQSNVSIYDYESRLDIDYFIHAFRFASKIRSKKDREVLQSMLGTQIDFQNILWIYRCKRFYEMTETDIMNHIIPHHYLLTAAKLYQLVSADTIDQFMERLNNTHYQYLSDNMKGLVLEKNYFRMRAKVLKRIKNQYPLSIACILNYLFEKDYEVQQITMVLECVRYQKDPTDIIRFLSAELVED